MRTSDKWFLGVLFFDQLLIALFQYFSPSLVSANTTGNFTGLSLTVSYAAAFFVLMYLGLYVRYLPLSLLAGGLASNLMSLLLRGWVPDYIPLFSLRCNVADLAIIAGVVWLIIWLIKKEPR